MRVLVTGATGLLGGWLVDELVRAGDDVVAVGGPRRGDSGVDLCDPEKVRALVGGARADVVIHAAAIATDAGCARDPEHARRLNVVAPMLIAQSCAETSTRLVHVSTDMVFDGEHAPYSEAASPTPTSIYGRTKREAELVVLATPNAVVVRLPLLFGPTRNDRRGFFDQQLEALRSNGPLRLFDDEWRTPLALDVAVRSLRRVATSAREGLFHLAGKERISRFAMGLALARALDVATPQLERASRLEMPGAPRPRDLSLDTRAFEAAFGAIGAQPFEAECRRLVVPS